MNSQFYLDLLQLLAPEAVVVFTALLVLAADLLLARDTSQLYRKHVAVGLLTVGCLGAATWMFLSPGQTTLFGGTFVVDPLNETVKGILLVLTVLTALISVDSKLTQHVGEYFALLLLATVGMMLLSSTEDLLTIFVALELTSLSLYILTAFDRGNPASAEAALKYFLFGGLSAAFLLFGFSLVYGLTGSTSLPVISVKLATLGADPLLAPALVMIMIGFGFKVAAVPFHLWAPDAYQGAPLPSAAFIASGSKLASFFVFAKMLLVGFGGLQWGGTQGGPPTGWVPLLSIIAVLSMILGNVAAIAQRSVRRLLAYSAIAHAGYVLVGFLASGPDAFASVLYYAATYAATTIGAFAVVGVVERHAGGDSLDDFAGLAKRAPVLAWCLLIFLLSLAGIPPLAGFFGKFYLFAAALTNGSDSLPFLWVIIVGVAMSAVSLYYYLQVLKRAFVAEPSEAGQEFPVPFLTRAVVVLVAVLVVLLGCFPDLLLRKLQWAINLVGM